jgi:ATP-binding cassette subfamily C protein
VVRSIKLALKFMTIRERWTYLVFLVFRGLTSALDLIGILAIGFLATSVALSLSPSSDGNSPLSLASLSLPTVQLNTLPIFIAVILLIFIAKAVMSVILTAILARFLAKIEARAVKVIVKNSFGRGLENARLQTKEDVIFAVQVGSQGAFNGLLNSTGVLFAEGILFLLVLASFALIDPVVALGAILYFGVIGFLIQFFLGQLMEKTGKKITRSVVETNTGISDLAEVVRESYILGTGEHFYKKIYRARLSASGNHATQFVLAGMPRYIVETALLAAIAVFILIQALNGDLASSAATLAVFLSGGLRLTASLLPLQAALLNIKQSIPPAEKAFELLFLSDYEDEEQSNYRVVDRERSPVSVSLRKLCFAYDKSNTHVLSNISLEIPKGSQAAFIGTSGAGKSTIADIVLGILEPSSGEVLVDGVKPGELIRQEPGIFGYVPQRPGMVSGTIAENIALGCDAGEIDSVKLERAIRDSHLSALIESLPLGINTDIGNRKDELSGGQIQRIGLARALYRGPRLLILDEATSALDAESENEINGALNDLRGKVTVIMVAHRLNTIQRSDVVFLVQDGQIADRGTFSDLLETNKTVKRLAQLMDIE